MNSPSEYPKVTTFTGYPTRLWFMRNGIERLMQLGEPESVPKGMILAKPNIIPEFCYIVIRGRVITYEYTTAGSERVYNISDSGSLLLEANVISREAPSVYFKTTEPSQLVKIRRSELMSALIEDPQIMMDIIDSISGKFFASIEQIREGCNHNVPWKICNLLLIFADRYGVVYDDKVLIQEKLSQQMIANLLGINRITAVRALKELKDVGLIEQINGYYCIRDRDKLKRHQEHFDMITEKK